jgi:hypothetical protein
VAIWLRVPDVPTNPRVVGVAVQWRGVKAVFAHPRFWWLIPVSAVGIGTFFSVQGLWSVPWLMEVEGYTRALAARHLFVMGAVMLAGYFLVGLFATWLGQRGIHARHLFAAGYALNLVALIAIVARLPGTYLWWALYGLGATVNVLTFTVLNDGSSPEVAGRANTAANLVMFVSSFAAQWGIGVLVDLARAALSYDTAAGLRLAFGVAIALYVLTFAWFARGWRRHARVDHSVT